jgi:oligopeptidase B
VVLELESKVTSEARVLSGDDPRGELRIIEPRRQGVEYAVEHHDGRFLIVTNADAENFRLVEASVERPGRDGWRDVIAHRPDVRLEDIDVFAEHLVVYERSEASRRIRVISLRDGGSHTVSQPESVSSAWGGANPEFGSRVLRYDYSSLVTPRSVYDYDMDSRVTRLLKRQPVLGGYDPDRYRTERAWATTSTAWTPSSRRCASACWIAVSSTPSPTCAVEVRWAGTGTKTASCCTRPTRSPISWPAPVTSSPRAGRRRRDW